MTTTTLTDEQNLYFMAWRATALQHMPYMASVIFAFRPVATTAVDTYAVDPGLRLYVNFEKCIPLGAVFNGQAILHEASHVLAEHNMLADVCGVTPEERKAWNLAADFAINDDLRDAGCDALAAHGVFAAQIGEPDYLTPMHYMDVLRKKMQKSGNKPKQGQGAPGTGQGQPQPGSGQPGQDPAPMKGCGSGAGGEKGSYELPDKTTDGKGDAATPMEKELVRIATAANIKNHQQAHGIGSVPGAFSQMIEESLAESKTPWEQKLGAFVRRSLATKAGNFDTTYRRRNRRRMNETLSNGQGRIVGRVIAPGYEKPVPIVHFFRDTSGSVSNHDLAVATNEVFAISRRLGIRGDELTVSDIDVRVHQSKKFNGKESVKEVQGRGGTDMRNAVIHACEQKRKPSVIVIATDGETPWPEARPSVPVVVLLVNVRNDRIKDAVPSWAHLVEVDSNV